MIAIATCTDCGPVREVNEDACCVEVADSALGEVAMGVVCDGVGGLARGELASATVVMGLVGWFEDELPRLISTMAPGGSFDPEVARGSWEGLLQGLNDLIGSYGTSSGASLGTTFTGILACDGTYLLGHVGDARAYLLRGGGLEQLSHDQVPSPTSCAGHTILQAVGTEHALRPAFSSGRLEEGDLLVICSDGAWRRAGNDGVLRIFGDVGTLDEGALADACRRLLRLDLERGERDNLTVVCMAGGWGVAGQEAPTMVGGPGDELPTIVTGGGA